MSDNSYILKNGNKILLIIKPFLILDNEFVNPKGQAFTRVKIRNLLNNKVLEKTIKIGETVSEAVVDFSTKMQFLYKESDKYVFMNLESFEQTQVDSSIVSENARWFIDGNDCDVTMWNNEIIQVNPAKHVSLKVVSTIEVMKGDTVSSTLKEAELENGESIMVPIFIKEGEIIRVDTESNEYASREK